MPNLILLSWIRNRSNLFDQIGCVLLGVGALLHDPVEQLAAGHSSNEKKNRVRIGSSLKQELELRAVRESAGNARQP